MIRVTRRKSRERPWWLVHLRFACVLCRCLILVDRDLDAVVLHRPDGRWLTHLIACPECGHMNSPTAKYGRKKAAA